MKSRSCQVFYFNVPIVSINDPSGTERNARFQVQVAEAIAAFLKNQKGVIRHLVN